MKGSDCAALPQFVSCSAIVVDAITAGETLENSRFGRARLAGLPHARAGQTLRHKHVPLDTSIIGISGRGRPPPFSVGPIKLDGERRQRSLQALADRHSAAGVA